MTDMRFNPNNGSLGKVPGQQPKGIQSDPYNIEPPVPEQPGGEPCPISAQGAPSPQYSPGEILDAANGFTGINQSTLQMEGRVQGYMSDFHQNAGIAIHEVNGLFQGNLSDSQKMDLAMLALNRHMDNNPVVPGSTTM